MKADIAYVDSSGQRNTERLDRAIEVLVIQRVFVVVNTGRRIGHFVTHKPDAIVSRVRLDLIHRRAAPSRDGWLHSSRRA